MCPLSLCILQDPPQLVCQVVAFQCGLLSNLTGLTLRIYDRRLFRRNYHIRLRHAIPVFGICRSLRHAPTHEPDVVGRSRKDLARIVDPASISHRQQQGSRVPFSRSIVQGNIRNQRLPSRGPEVIHRDVPSRTCFCGSRRVILSRCRANDFVSRPVGDETVVRAVRMVDVLYSGRIGM